ncbi:MAG: L,D-transpeptidase family protein [Ferruginibacter sp.]|nr:L,D-transpeptidase family protein [Ferruginibacter sp.]MBU9936152.1 L,D-transpeptidase family protein [Ferruginibacter sp.]
MQHPKLHPRYLAVVIMSLFLVSCGGNGTNKEDVVADPKAMDKSVAENIGAFLEAASGNDGNLDDSIHLKMLNVLKEVYQDRDDRPLWSSTEKWQPFADSLYHFIEQAELQGLFPEDYHFSKLRLLKTRLDADSLSRMDAVLWTRADLLLTDGLVQVIKDLKVGRLRKDSVSLNKDSVLYEDFYVATLRSILKKKQFSTVLDALQPAHQGYWELKKGIRSFLDSMDRRVFTHIRYPFKKGDAKDSAFFIKLLQQRLAESKCIDLTDKLPDSVQLSLAIKRYQEKKGLKADGKYGKILVSTLNNNDVERFKRIAITLDRYKQLPKKMPEKYIWVNLPGYYLCVVESDTVVFESKIICGKPETRTPLLNAQVSDMITYPTWTVPTSIIVKQYLPKLKKNPNYLTKIGLHLLDKNGEVVDPNTVPWEKYSKGIPYKVMQGSGDDNSLGVIKFNFNNRYAVYLHDTNQRYLFKNSSRAFSHGCVRVQEWEKLAFYIARNDSALLSIKNGSLKYTADSIRNWIAKKDRRRIDVKNQVPLFIRYFSCEGKDGKIKFYDDIYGEDKLLMEKYFAKK